ncbi:hypothetical protein [Bradyrhizobium sp. CB1015]|uniref:hypothetical protein n=1 Tax=Bradyrhizobium sp. CB1015 TaxID=2976822 RepID=UPI0021A9F6C8|nr:hypothetical protein [Bradyrhizobium sp. CB1015]UWU95135.1 hypothetical protein N2604_15305 [Bradyrhizobium sp. CB1015]
MATFSLSRLILLTLLASTGTLDPTAAASDTAQDIIPAAVRGPFISHPSVITELDCPAGKCGGPLDFTRLIQARAQASPIREELGKNPFKLRIAKKIAETIGQDLDELAAMEPDAGGHQIDKNFLTDEDSRVELVGIVNRMDRQFIIDSGAGLSPRQRQCGEISIIYRFAYSLRDRDQKSRLPVTLNLVLPALPSKDQGGQITCQTIAKRWLDAIPASYELQDDRPSKDVEKVAAQLLDPKTGPLAFIDGRDIIRIELNIQAYRKPAGIAKDFGTEAAYVIRVFKWQIAGGYFDADLLRNQIDRDLLLCDPRKPNECPANQARRKRLLAYFSQPDVMQSIDWGTLDIDDSLGVLAKRAMSVSPGGTHRSRNQSYWNAHDSSEQIITDDEIRALLRFAEKNKISFSFIKSPQDFRARLNGTTCIGCHQTRAIAGFHFPGADRSGTYTTNSILLPGSPHFYGDQPRRLALLSKIASGQPVTNFELATSYPHRPMNKFRSALAGTSLIGGWGGACLSEDSIRNSKREWTCQTDHECIQPFRSADERSRKSGNEGGLGICVTSKGAQGNTIARQIGDALQLGEVVTKSWGKDRYFRYFPNEVSADADTIIPKTALPQKQIPGNSYYGAHQEYHQGKTDWENRELLRDAETGGFPAGMLRLSECVGLPSEASCGLVASTGFNTCIAKLGSDAKVNGKKLTIGTCFDHFTSFAGLRACTAGSPCRDDYICVKPMGYRPGDASSKFVARSKLLQTSGIFAAINEHTYSPSKFYGQVMPDQDWVDRDDQRGLCIPPYFVFQFRADGHPGPRRTAD